MKPRRGLPAGDIGLLERIAVMPALNAVGSLILLAIAANLIGVKKIKTADYLPALAVCVLASWVLTLL